ncbi:hypothetical protein [Aquibacillus kalidii]|uniref:hypothetical protein n=1 Tax=Aquibacillus kalidii TaxID=2762597 RepID=UPI001644EF60|nr:hypothetical protein [Aquibacillus kalidii]
MLKIDYILFLLFTVAGWCLIIGLTNKEKKWIGGIGGVLVTVFIIVSQIIKFQSGFFETVNNESSQTVGKWVLPCFIVLGVYLLGMINYRWIKAALKKQAWQRWGLIVLDLFFSLLYIWCGGFLVFIVAFTYFPFAP